MKHRVLVTILDGIGFNPELESDILKDAWEALDEAARERLDKAVAESAALGKVAKERDDHAARCLLMTPTIITQAHGLLRDGALDERGIEELRKIREKLSDARVGGRGLSDHVHAARAEAAYNRHYIPWCIKTPTLWELRECYPTFVAHPAGLYAGYPETTPAIMGNSDTGHQQIMNLCVAKQLSMTITDMIREGDFDKIDDLNAALRKAATEDGGHVVARFMASGEFGDDGFVHSCFPHLDGFLHLYFDVLGLSPERLKLELILDGRDSPPDSSIVPFEKEGIERYNFLQKIREKLAHYNAVESIGWIIGRAHMDRDYKGGMIRVDYEMLVRNKGRRVADLDEALKLIAKDHESGKTDPQVEAIVIGDPQPVDKKTCFFNLQFRADRQEPITACLLGMKDFVMQQAEEKKKTPTWDDCEWFADLGGLRMFTLAEYNSEFTGPNCTPIATDKPHAHNLLWLLHKNDEDFRFFFLGEGVKEKHVGMFSRGRRSQPLTPNEDRLIIPSYGKEEGVNNDNDFYKKPMMRHPEIGDELVKRLAEKKDDLILVNVPGADMVGHLVMGHFDAGIETLQSVEDYVKKILPAAEENGWSIIATADHGNLEHFGADHGNNDILTSVIVHPEAEIEDPRPTLRPGETARLFDNSWTALYLMGGAEKLRGKLPEYPAVVKESEKRLWGQSLIAADAESALSRATLMEEVESAS